MDNCYRQIHCHPLSIFFSSQNQTIVAVIITCSNVNV